VRNVIHKYTQPQQKTKGLIYNNFDFIVIDEDIETLKMECRVGTWQYLDRELFSTLILWFLVSPTAGKSR
jgi:hypothetical protein